MIKNGSVVSFEYTLSDENGEVIESNRGEEPVSYTHGAQQIIPGLEKGFLGMEINEKKSIRVEPEEAYGPVNSESFKEIPKREVPAGALKKGTMLQARGPRGEEFSVRVHDITPETVVLDLNHPLAGKTLNFDVKVLSIEEEQPE
jgi:FKBP-type peptidyl-prolyl cis-trans isomerase 2